MTIEFTDGSNYDGLFDILGKAFHAQSTIETAVGTTVPAEVEDAIDQYRLRPSDPKTDGVDQPLLKISGKMQSGGLSSQRNIRSYASSFLTGFVDSDASLLNPSLQNALGELIRQMIAESESVDASTVAASVSGSGNNSDCGFVVSVKRGDGRTQENLLAETLDMTPVSESISSSLTFRSRKNRADLLSHEWPAGSGTATTLSTVLASAGLLTNGDFEDESDVTDAPDDWEVVVGTVGTTIKMTNIEVQTVTISGSPTSGTYVLHWTDPNGNAWTTSPLPYTASASSVQTALRQFAGLSQIVVTSTGTAPNYAHTITFTGAGGNLNQLTSTSSLDTGSIAHATTVAGTGQVFYGGKALEFDSDGAQLTQIRQRVAGLSASTAYAVSLWAIADVVPAAGVITIDLIDGSGSVVTDDQGAPNSFTFNAADLTTSWQHLSDLVSGETVFRTPEVVPTVLYIRLRVSTAISSGTSVFFDSFAMAQMTELYSGGPLVAVFAGSSIFRSTDEWTLTSTNDRAGKFQEWFHRNFDMAAKGLLLPSDSGGSETIDDALIA